MATSKLVRDDIIRIDGQPFRRLLVYRIEVDPVEGQVDLLLTAADYNITSVAASVVVPFRQNAAFELIDVVDSESAGTIMIRAGHQGSAAIKPSPNPASLDGPSRLRLRKTQGTPSAGVLRFDIGISVPLNAANPTQGIVVLPPSDGQLPPNPDPGPTQPGSDTGSLEEKVSRLLSTVASLQEQLGDKESKYTVSQQIAGLIGSAPSDVQTMGQLYTLIQRGRQDIDALVAGATSEGDTFAELYARIQAEKQASEERDAAIVGDAPADGDTLGELYDLLQAARLETAGDLAALVGGAPAEARTLGQLYTLLQVQQASTTALNQQIIDFVGGAPAVADSLNELYSLLTAAQQGIEQRFGDLVGTAPTGAQTLGDLYNLILNDEARDQIEFAGLIGTAPPGAQTLGDLYGLICLKEDQGVAAQLDAALVGTAPEEGNTLGKLYDLIKSIGTPGSSTSSQQTYNFPTPALTWTIYHGRGTSRFQAMAYNASGVQQFVLPVAVDQDTIRFEFTEPVSGYALVMFW